MAVITFSRQFGSSGDEIAARVAALLGYSIFDKTMMAKMAAEVVLSELEIVDFSETDYRSQSFPDRLLGRTKNVGEIRGKGLMVIIEFVDDAHTKAKLDPALNIGGKLQAATRQRGLISRVNNDGIAFAPPLIISADEVDFMIETTASAISEVLG